jgi:uncharacterized membrane protein
MKANFLFIFLMIVSASQFCCESATYNEVAGQVTNPTYSQTIKPIMDNNCVQCHSKEADLFPILDTYEAVKIATQTGDVICRIDDQSCGRVMPQAGKMADVKINNIKKWAKDGFPN